MFFITFNNFQMFPYLSPLRPTGLSPLQMGRDSYIIGNAKCKAGLCPTSSKKAFLLSLSLPLSSESWCVSFATQHHVPLGTGVFLIQCKSSEVSHLNPSVPLPMSRPRQCCFRDVRAGRQESERGGKMARRVKVPHHQA